MTDPELPPDVSWLDYGDDDRPRSSFAHAHPGRFVALIVVGVFSVVGGLAWLIIAFGGPGLVYDPQVVHRTVIGNDGRVHDCAVSSSGMSCDWNSP